MTTPVIHVVAVLVLLVAPGVLPARAVTGSWKLAVPAAPLATGVLCATAAVVSLALRASWALSLAAVVVFAYGSALVFLHRRPAPAAGTASRVGWGQLAVLALVLGFLLLAVRRAPIDWDTRAIWFTHADWVAAGGESAAQVLGFRDSRSVHPDYPPLGPATIAAVWLVLGRDHEVAQLALALLTASAALVLAAAMQLALRVPRWSVGLIGAAVLLATYGLAGGYATNGYVDVLWAAAFAAAAVCLLTAPAGDRAATGLGALCLAAAMATKNEGMVAGAGLVVLLVARNGRRGLVTAAAPVALALSWTVTSKLLGATGDMLSGDGLSRLVRLDPDVLARMAPTAEAFWDRVHRELILAAGLTAVGLLVAKSRRRELSGAGAGWLWAATVVCLGGVGSAYLITPHDIDWHLATSVGRTVFVARVLLLVESAVWLVVLGAVLFSPDASADAVPPPRGSRRHVDGGDGPGRDGADGVGAEEGGNRVMAPAPPDAGIETLRALIGRRVAGGGRRRARPPAGRGDSAAA